MDKKPTNTPLIDVEIQEETQFLSITGVERYRHLMSSLTTIIVAILLFISGATFFVLHLLTFLGQVNVIDPAIKTLYAVFSIALLALTLIFVGLSAFVTFTSTNLRLKVKKEVHDKTLSIAKQQWLTTLLQLIISGLILVTLIVHVILFQLNPASSIAFIVLIVVQTFLSFAGFYITNSNKKAIILGPNHYENLPVQPIGALEGFLSSLGTGLVGLLIKLFNFVMLFVKAFLSIFIGIYKLLVGAVKKTIAFVKRYIVTFRDHSFRTKIAYFFMGSGHFFMGRPIKAIMFLLLQIGYTLFMVLPNAGGLYWLSKFDNLGDSAFRTVEECAVIGVNIADCPPDDIISRTVFMDNSMLIALYSVATILLSIAFFVFYWLSIRSVAKADQKYSKALEDYDQAISLEKEQFMAATLGNQTQDSNLEKLITDEERDQLEKEFIPSHKFVNPLPTFREELRSLLNERFHIATLSVPTITITIFTILPLVFMIILAFTNYSGQVGPPNSLFRWVGLQTFTRLFSSVGGSSFSKAFADILQWTFIWAFFATFTNYILGLILAMIINRKGIKLKKLWRTVFVITIAVPQFVTLLLMSRLLNKYGPLNETLLQLGWISEYIEFLSHPTTAKISVILVNIWVGVPYTMLITSGILMNIPADLYESARIDGAGPLAQFSKITLPYMLFVTGPYLITQFIGNINNFNVIFFLTGGGPSAQLTGVQYGKTDILVTWLYNLTVGGAQQEYAIGSALGIFIFAISAFITLSLYSKTSAATQEGDFA